MATSWYQALKSRLSQTGVEQPAEDDRGWLPVSLHRFGAGIRVAGVGSGAQTDEGRQTVTYRNAVGPKTCRAAVEVGQGMDSHPLRMNPGTEVQNRRQLIGIRLLADRDQ